MRPTSRWAIPVLLLGLCSCTSDDPGGPSNAPRFVSATIAANPANTISAEAVIIAHNYDRAFVRFWAAGTSVDSTPVFPFAGDSTLRVPILGMDTSATYSLEINLISAAGAQTKVDTEGFTTGTLPTWVPAISAIGTDTTPGFLSMSFPLGAVIIDNSGKVRWFKSLDGGVLNTFQAHRNGTYTIIDVSDPETTFHVLNALGNEIGTLKCVNFPTRFHDLFVQAGGDYWIMCDDTRTMDLSGLGGVVDAQVMASVVQHISKDGQLLFEWNSFDHFQITDLPLADRTGPNVNFTHGNGLELDDDGNLIVSFRSLSEITKINTTTGDIMWRLGGLQNQFTFLNDPKGYFERQHGLRKAAPGMIQVLDNGLTAPSRFVRYLLNPQNLTALLVMEFFDSPTTFTNVGGNTQYYPNGHAVVSFGKAGRVVEVDPSGNRAWEVAGVDGNYVFRVQRFHSLYTPGEGEATH
ncbi:MAG: arylsulfotransferase family protein [Gemmatimonadota bacterium]